MSIFDCQGVTFLPLEGWSLSYGLVLCHSYRFVFFLVIDLAVFRVIYSFTDVRGVKSRKIELDMRRAQKGNPYLKKYI